MPNDMCENMRIIAVHSQAFGKLSSSYLAVSIARLTVYYFAHKRFQTTLNGHFKTTTLQEGYHMREEDVFPVTRD